MRAARAAGLLLTALPLIAGGTADSQAAGLEALAADGLYTWRVAAIDDAPPWCCASPTRGTPPARACDLDSRRAHYSTPDSGWSPRGEMQIYARIEAGTVDRIRVLGPRCAVTSTEDITDLGEPGVDESLAWLAARVTAQAAGSGDALAAIAVHRGPAALDTLVGFAAAGHTMDVRKDAIFWMSQARIAETADTLQRLMLGDTSADIRRHAAFALSQSAAPERAAALLRQGRDDPDREVRAQAWFWLAQSGDPQSEAAIRRAIADDAEVREDAVFALSQLPGERAVDALYTVLADLGLPREVREQALLWLVQSDSERAYAYIGRLLADGQ